MSPETQDRIETLAEARRRHIEALAERPSGIGWCEEHTDLVDRVIRLLMEDVAGEDLPPIAVIATGGYGRRELCPYSDIDITVVPSDEASPALDAAIRRFFQDLHSAFYTQLRMDVGYAYLLVADAPGLDVKSRTGLMDMRLLAGSYDLFRQLQHALDASFSPGEFILAKIREREEMFAKYYDTPLVVEPHLKEGAGGLRCFHCANWIRESIGERAARPTEAYDKILLARNLLHRNSGKHLDVLSRARQAEIADMLAVDMYSMMSDLADAAAELHGDYQRACERLHEARFPLSNGVLAVRGEARLEGHVEAGEAAVGVAIATQLGLRVADIRVGAAEPPRGPAAAFALATGEATIRNLDRCGLLGQILPELDACRTLMPTDTVHVYTVFEHTMRVVRALDGLEPGSFLGDVKDSINDLEPLYVAALLHDVGKIDPDRDHSELGADMAIDVCTRWGLAANVTDAVAWLIREHLTMSRFIRIRDLMSPATVEEFTEIVGDLNRLGMLTLLTYADIGAVSEGSWTSAQDTFLRQLYELTAACLQGEMEASVDPSQYRRRLLRQLAGRHGDEASVQAFVESLPAYYLTSTPPDLIRLHMHFAEKAAAGEPTVELFHRPDLGATELTVCTLDAPALLSRLLGVFYAFDLSLGGIRACTTMTEPPIALDVFTVSFSGRPVPPATCSQVSAAIMDVLANRKTAEEILRARGKDPERRQEIVTYTWVEGNPGILEIRAPRGRGMPFRLSRLVAEQGWNVVSARVGQWAGNATAAFYLQRRDGTALRRDEVAAAFA